MLAIATRADKNIKEMTDITHPIMRKYAEKVGADFLVLDDPKGLHPHYRILQFYDLFDKYDRIISMDSDIMILPDCPNLFEVVPEDEIGTIFEDVATRQSDRKERIKKANEQFGDIGWRSGYINTGVAVFSRCHKELFRQEELYMNLGYDDVYLGYRIRKFGFKIHELDWRFNFMGVFADLFGSKNKRYEAYIIHYAGTGFTGNRMEDIKKDYELFYGEFPYPKMKNQLIIDAIGECENIADVGCGEGILTNYLTKHYKNVQAIDIENKNKFGLDVKIWDIQDEPEGMEFDVVIASEVLEHIRWWKDALRNLLKITKKRLILTFPVGHSFFDPDHKNFFDDEKVEELKKICEPYKVEVRKEITKPEDVKANQLIYFICIQKESI